MKFENIQNVEKLFQIIRDECTGTVELVSTEGDRIKDVYKRQPMVCIRVRQSWILTI